MGGANYPSKNRSDFSRGANYRSKIRGDLSRQANYRLKNCAEQNNRCHENAEKFHGNIVSSEISSKSPKSQRISLKFVCVTFAQYCIPSGPGLFEGLQYCAKVMQAKCANFVLCSRDVSTKIRVKFHGVSSDHSLKQRAIFLRSFVKLKKIREQKR